MNDTGKRVYLDHNATTYMRQEVIDAMIPYFRVSFGNPSSLHFLGIENREKVEEARGNVAGLIGAEPEEVFFTSGGTESDNIAVRGVVRAARRKGRGCHIITSITEHPAVLKACEALEEEGCEVTFLGSTTDGTVRLDELKEAIRPDTVIVSIMLANNETGVIQPIGEIAELTRRANIVLHTDAVQGVGKIPVDVGELGVDLLSISAHKFYGPKGIGAIYVRRGTALDPVYAGGGHEGGLRPGTLNVPGIVGLGEAARITKERLPEEMERIGTLRDRLEQAVRERIDEIIFNGTGGPRVPNTSSIAVPRIEGEAITLNLSMLGFAVSSGSACASGGTEASHVLVSMGLDPADAQGGVRISLGIDNTKEDVDSFVDAFAGVIDRLRKLSPLGRHST